VIGEQRVVLDPLQITDLPRDVLGPPILSLANQDVRITNAMDALLSRAWRYSARLCPPARDMAPPVR
jgi:hypothetical protein